MTTISWVFGYGSLMWDPGFHPAEVVRARVSGYIRSYCLRSTIYRGTKDIPGLVLGLDESDGGTCTGLALRISAKDHDKVMDYLRMRELSTGAYRETVMPLDLEDGRRVEGLAYVIRRDNWQYAGGLPPSDQARMIARACGKRGPNCDYLFNTTRHLAEIGMADAEMENLAADVRRLMAEND